ncbi:hypothetical protein PV10_06539 [Exophiala mesophila]|uniref:Uncharacterized protein n=1 Tax=Exophiala mesophila TaxID=212818 RepID=A0A0D1ZZ10_EXOME|nr:uncharacterized protein PV10_06539 [Exophiala mesophila]KIV92068.1 hypothetical protein PV10_06539 [Exophiala mesophila]
MPCHIDHPAPKIDDVVQGSKPDKKDPGFLLAFQRAVPSSDRPSSASIILALRLLTRLVPVAGGTYHWFAEDEGRQRQKAIVAIQDSRVFLI